MKIEIDVDLDFYWDWYLKKHNKSKYTKEQLIPEIIKSIKWHAEHWWMADGPFIEHQNQHLESFMKTVIHNTSFHVGDTVIVKTEEEQPIDENSVVRLY